VAAGVADVADVAGESDDVEAESAFSLELVSPVLGVALVP
jgi:hypothetical protein